MRVYVSKAPSWISVSAPRTELGVGETMQMSYSLPSGTASAAAWAVNDESIATVDANGTVTALKEGTVLVRGSTYNGKYSIQTIQVKPAPTSVSLNPERVVIGAGQSMMIAAKVNDGSACGSFTFKSLNPEIADITANGWMSGYREGECEIEVTAYNGVTSKSTVIVKAAPTKVELKYSVMYLGVGEIMKLDVTTDSEIGGFTYSTSNSRYVQTNSEGYIYGARRGNAYVTVRTYNGLTATARVYVVKAPTSVSISPANAVLGVGDRVRFSAWTPSGTASAITYLSSNPAILEIDSATGEAAAKSGGEVLVAAQTYNGKTAWSRVTIYSAPEWIETDFASAAMSAGETKKIQIRLSEGSYSQIRYTSSNPAVARVNAEGVITAVARGEATILVETSVKSVFAQVSVEVWNAPTWVRLDAAKSLNVDETMKLEPEIDADARTTWTFASSNPQVATVNAAGEVTAVNRGQTILSARAHNGVSAQTVLTVYDPWYPETLEIIDPPEVLNVGDVYTVETRVTPETAVPRLKWSSTNPEIAQVDENGRVTAVSGGFTYIIATSEKNSACQALMLLCVKSGSLAIQLPKRQTNQSGISENLNRIAAIKASAFDEINDLQRRGQISASDAAKRKEVLTNAFADYSFVWMTPAYQRYWKAENSENGVKDFKPGVVYYGMPYISGGADNRRYNWQKAVGENRYVYGGDGYYLLNQSRLLNGLYVGNDCSSFCNAANWGVTSSRIGDRTDDIFTSSYYKTVSLNNLRPGDMICLANRHVVFFLYYVDSAHTQIMILENGGAEAGVNTVHCSLYPLNYYTSLGYRGRRLKTLG